VKQVVEVAFGDLGLLNPEGKCIIREIPKLKL